MRNIKDYISRTLAVPYRKLIGEIEDPNLVAWIETFMVSLLMLLFSWLVDPDDVLFLQQDFPWILIAPLFLALRHGFMFGFASALLFIALAVFLWSVGWSEHELSTTVILGLLITTSLAGEFSDFWQRRIGRMEIESIQRNRRMEEFTHSYHLLRTSHDQLSEKMAGSMVSLRQAIANLRQEMLATEYDTDPLKAKAERILALFRRYAAVQSASLHRVEHGKLEIQSLGHLGSVPEDLDMLSRSKIVHEALTAKQMMSVLAEDSGRPHYVDGNVLAVVPVGDLTGKTWAVLIIYRIPFLKFTEENLSLIAVMASCLGDLLSELNKELQSEQESQIDFFTELKFYVHYARLYGIIAKLVTVELPEGHPDEFKTLLSLSRSLDKTSARVTKDGIQIALWLMPFSDDFAVAGFQARINIWARSVFSGIEENELVKFHTFDINGSHSAEAIMEQVTNACNLADS